MVASARRVSLTLPAYIERVELHLIILLSRVQGVEVGKTIDAKNDCLAIDHKLLLPVLQRGLDNPGIALDRVVAVAGDQLDTVAVALDAKSITIIFYFVDPIRSGGTLVPRVGMQKSNALLIMAIR